MAIHNCQVRVILWITILHMAIRIRGRRNTGAPTCLLHFNVYTGYEDSEGTKKNE